MLAMIGLVCETFGISPDAYFEASESRREFMRAYARVKIEAQRKAGKQHGKRGGMRAPRTR